MSKTVLSVVESPTFPRLSELFAKLAFNEVKVHSIRKAISAVKKIKPDFLFAEFYYGYGNNYAGVNVSNLDVMLSSLPIHSPLTKTVIFVQKDELQYVERLTNLFPIEGAFLHTAPLTEIEKILLEPGQD